MDRHMLTAMRLEAGACFDTWISQAQAARSRVTASLVWPGSRSARAFTAQILARAALALLCLLGPGLIFRGFFTGNHSPREEAKLLWMHRGAFITVGLYWLMSAVYHWKILRAEQGKDTNLRRADRIIAALRQKKEALELAGAGNYAAAAATDIEVGRELAALEAGSQLPAVDDSLHGGSAFRRRFRPLHLRGRRKNTPLSLLYWLGLLLYVIVIMISIEPYFSFTIAQITYLLMSAFLSMGLALFFGGDLAGADCLSSLLPFSGVVIATLIVRSVAFEIGFVAMVVTVFWALSEMNARDS